MNSGGIDADTDEAVLEFVHSNVAAVFATNAIGNATRSERPGRPIQRVIGEAPRVAMLMPLGLA
jgi:hypothetical protein